MRQYQTGSREGGCLSFREGGGRALVLRWLGPSPHMGGAPPNPSVGGKSALLSGLRGRDGALVGSA